MKLTISLLYINYFVALSSFITFMVVVTNAAKSHHLGRWCGEHCWIDTARKFVMRESELAWYGLSKLKMAEFSDFLVVYSPLKSEFCFISDEMSYSMSLYERKLGQNGTTTVLTFSGLLLICSLNNKTSPQRMSCETWRHFQRSSLFFCMPVTTNFEHSINNMWNSLSPKGNIL